MSRFLPALLVLALVVPAAAAQAADSDENPCTDDVGALPYSVTVDGEDATGHVSFPAAETKQLVVFAHGYSHTSYSWTEHMERVTEDTGAVTVAMDYRGTVFDAAAEEVPTSRGWRVREGAADLVAAAQDLVSTCGAFDTVVLFSVSMGSNAAGLAVASKPTSPLGGPLFDHWFNLEGAVNVAESYNEARALAPANAFAANAVADMEEEFGGSFEAVPDAYLEASIVNRVDDIAAAGLTSVYMIHGAEDGLVPYHQAAVFATQLRRAGVPRLFVTVGTRGEGEGGTTITGYSGVGASPGAGHASERSTTHEVMVRGFDRLESLLVEGTQICMGEFVVAGTFTANFGGC